MNQHPVPSILARLGALEPDVLTNRLDTRQLARLAQALHVPRTGPKATVAERIIDRCHLISRTLDLGDDPTEVAANHRRIELVALVRQWGGWKGANKYGLAAQAIGPRDQLLRSVAADLNEPRRPGTHHQPRLF